MATLQAVTGAPVAPPLPPGRFVDLPGRGGTFVREVGPVGAPAIILLHGWCVNADLNWWPVFPALADGHRVVAPDLRGHSRSVADGRRFTLEACADDVAALAAELDLPRFTAVGYSMGGAVAQLVWRRHRSLLDGLVLCATSQTFSGRPKELGMRSLLDALAPTARAMPPALRAELASRVLSGRRDDHEQWAWAAATLRSHDWMRIVEAGQELLRFDARGWACEIDVATAVVVTSADSVVPHHRQLRLAAAIPGASTHHLPGGHTACAATPTVFADVLADACASLTARGRLADSA
jgi:pimeloyl-ACP methyl ester carboxylesterase